MSPLLNIYRDYLACLNGQAWDDLANFVYDRVRYNDPICRKCLL
jgi:predicted ester cyclase